MDYLGLFKETNIQDGGDNFRCLYYRQEGNTELECLSHYPMLFVLQGRLKMHFKYGRCTIDAGNWVVIDAELLTKYNVANDTIVLVYRPPLRLEMILKQCSQMYQTPVSEVVPILTPLQTWIDGVLTEHLQGKVWSGQDAHTQRRELASIMTNGYTQRQLGELFAAFSVCAIGDCEQCYKELSIVVR